MRRQVARARACVGVERDGVRFATVKGATVSHFRASCWGGGGYKVNSPSKSFSSGHVGSGMSDSNSFKPGSRPAGNPPTSSNAPASASGSAAKETAPGVVSGKTGHVVHDERGNAVWDWLKDTTRIAIESTSRLLKRLEVPELQVEEEPEEELRIESERDPGGGYDPYQRITPRQGGGGAGGGGGYDPYQKAGMRKPSGRKP